MPRTLDPAAHALKREAFLDAADQLIRTKGFDAMSIQDLLDALGTSKGAFYHYFGSKEDLLEACVERIADQALAAILPEVGDRSVPADERLRRLFQLGGRWKSDRRDLFLGLLEVWLSDGNAVARAKLRRVSAARTLPLLAEIVRQGADDGTFGVGSPEHAAQVLLTLGEGAAQATSELLLRGGSGAASLLEVRATMGAYEAATERFLGMTPGTFSYMDEPTLRLWFG